AVGMASLMSRKIDTAHILPQHSLTPIISWVANTEDVINKNTIAINELYLKMKHKGMSEARFRHPHYPTNLDESLGIMCGTPFNGDTAIHHTDRKNGERFTLLEVADFIDSLSWEDHNPANPPHPYRFNPDLLPANMGSTNLYRHPTSGIATGNKIPNTSDPYSIAAYLRLWHFWALANQTEPMKYNCLEAPEFNVIFREGTSSTKWQFPDGEEIKLRRYRRPITHLGQLTGYEWGSMNRTANFGSNKHNDDIRDEGSWPTDGKWRSYRSTVRANHLPGMLQIRFIEDEHENKLPVVSLSIPFGGPRHSYIG
ncbi:MAG: hypothetical protein ACJ0CN_00675, partial [Candidatus Poseidoniaceae archaeon]